MSSVNMSRASLSRSTAGGFSLVELMVAMVLGLIVIGSVIALVLSMMRANNQTIASTRLTQELRAVAALMANDLRRAGGVLDPLTVATSAAGNTLAAIDTTTAGCIRYSYAGAEGGNFHSIFLSGNDIYMKAGANVAAANCTASPNDNPLNSRQVIIVPPLLNEPPMFERQSPCGTPNPAGRCIRINLRGRLTGDANITRQYSQDIYVRSISGA